MTAPAKRLRTPKPRDGGQTTELAPRPARPNGRRPGGALYKRIAEQIGGDIATGKFALGSLLPTEAEFSERLDVGRLTVREALRLLSDEGLISRRPGSGSTVIASGRPAMFTHAVSNFDQWFNYPEVVQRRHLDRVALVADAEQARSLGCEVGTQWWRVGAVRTLNASAPLCWVDIYIPLRFARVMSNRSFEATPVHEQIEAMFQVAIAEVEVSISAGRVPGRMARALEVVPDSPALLLRRRYLGADGELLQVTCTVHPENRYAYTMRFRRTAASQYAAV
jgi:DNA-binding GntR family transcriptional regulator